MIKFRDDYKIPHEVYSQCHCVNVFLVASIYPINFTIYANTSSFKLKLKLTNIRLVFFPIFYTTYYTNKVIFIYFKQFIQFSFIFKNFNINLDKRDGLTQIVKFRG